MTCRPRVSRLQPMTLSTSRNQYAAFLALFLRLPAACMPPPRPMDRLSFPLGHRGDAVGFRWKRAGPYQLAPSALRNRAVDGSKDRAEREFQPECVLTTRLLHRGGQ
jgi:hypothetical protein